LVGASEGEASRPAILDISYDSKNQTADLPGLFFGDPSFSLLHDPLHCLQVVCSRSADFLVGAITDGSDILLGLLQYLGSRRQIGSEELGSQSVEREDSSSLFSE